MRSFISLALLALTLAAPALASEVTSSMVLTDEHGDMVRAVVDQQVALAKRGKGEEDVVRLPLGNSDMWGCLCPRYYVGIETTMGLEAADGESTWISLRLKKGLAAPAEPTLENNPVIYAVGTFTGRTRREAGKVTRVFKVERFEAVTGETVSFDILKGF